MNPATLNIQPGDKIEVDAPAVALTPRCNVPVRIRRVDGSIETLTATAAVETQLETRLLRSGGVIPLILQKTIAAQAS